MAAIDLGKLKPTYQGQWQNSVAYEVDDFVQYQHSGITSTFICVLGHTNQAPATGEAENSTYWRYMSKGTAAEKMAHNTIRTSNFSATGENAYFVDTTNGVVTITFPAAPQRGDQIQISDYRGTFSENPVTINRSGQLIEGQPDDWVIHQKGAVVEFTFDDGISGDGGWRVTKFQSDYNQELGGQTNRGVAVKNVGSRRWPIATSDAEEIYIDGDDVVHKFLTSGTFKVHALGTDSVLGDKIEYLIIGGGGSGGTHHAGGGGAGGYRANNSKNYAITAQNYAVVVGTGGSQRTSNSHGHDGGSSTFDGMVSGGGGGGGSSNSRGRDGGSGGGAAHGHTHGNANGQGSGNRGGTHESHTHGGGGGAHQRGSDNYGHHEGGHGGRGERNDITGRDIWYAGGGGASGHNHTSAAGGGHGGGAQGGGAMAEEHTGGGGGGCDGNASQLHYGGKGADGIVVIRYKGRI